MILTITTTRPSGTATTDPASDLGFLLHKHPERLQSFDVATGTAHVFYPEATSERCTAALLLEVDPIRLVRGRKGPSSEGFALGQFVNDRPYAASSMLSTAMTKVFKTAMTGRCDSRPELAASPLSLEIRVPALPCRGGADLVRRLFAPMGWTVDAVPVVLDETLPAWGDSRYADVTLTGDVRLADALAHLYVLLPVLDDAKHYWVSPDEVEKLIRAGEGWLSTHPERTLITTRYLAHRGVLARDALARLAEVDDLEPDAFDDTAPSVVSVPAPTPEDAAAHTPSLAVRRRDAVLEVVRAQHPRRVGDLGCGEGVLVGELLADGSIDEVVAVDVSVRSLEQLERRLKVDRMTERQRSRLLLWQSSLVYRDTRLTGLDVAVLMEVVEHVDPPRLAALERTVSADACPTTVVVTTPNAEHNVRYPALAAGRMRHRDHRFEWTRAEFAAWSSRVASSHGYTVEVLPVGDDDTQVGPPTQMAVFSRVVLVPGTAADPETAAGPETAVDTETAA